MQNPLILFLAILGLVFSSCEDSNSTKNSEMSSIDSKREFFQLKIYSFKSDRQVLATDKFLKEAYLPSVKKLGIDRVGVFRLKQEPGDTIKKTYVLIPSTDLNALLTLDEALDKDANYLETGSDYITAIHDEPPYERMESIVLKSFGDMPILRPSALESPRSERIYEIRSYESATEKIYRNKVDMFNAGGEIKLFDKLGFNAVFYGEVVAGPSMPNLMYMITFDDMESRGEHWKSFVDAPEWKAMSSLPKYQNNISHIDKYFLYPTEYSDY